MSQDIDTIMQAAERRPGRWYHCIPAVLAFVAYYAIGLAYAGWIIHRSPIWMGDGAGTLFWMMLFAFIWPIFAGGEAAGYVLDIIGDWVLTIVR